ncbi:MAG: DapH/DapD/GlmU-related protein [Polyangia bacterium]
MTLDLSATRGYRSRGDGLGWAGRLAALGQGAVIEDGVRIFHPENVSIGALSFVGHDAILDGYHEGRIAVGEGSWIGPLCYLHGAAGIDIGRAVGIGPRVTVLTSQHELGRIEIPVLHADLSLEPIRIEDGADVGAGAVLLPGVRVGRGAVVGAGSVLTRDVSALTVVAGNPARPLRGR